MGRVLFNFFIQLLKAVIGLLLPLTLLLNYPLTAYSQPTYKPYTPPARSSYADKRISDLSTAAKKVSDAMAKSLAKTNQAVNSYGRQIARDVAPGGAISNRSLYGHSNIAKKHPHGDIGALNPAHSWLEYAKESTTILGTTPKGIQKFASCVQWRIVTNPEYNAICALNCPTVVFPSLPICACPFPYGCQYQAPGVVIEYFWPEYTVATNKAASKDLNPLIFSNGQARADLTRPALIASKRAMEAQILGLLAKKIPGFDPSKYKNPAWRQGEFEFQDDKTYSRTYRPNFEWRAADDRPNAYWKGWELESKSLHWALPPPPSKKNIIKNSNDQGLLYLLRNHPEMTQAMMLLKSGDYQKTVGMPANSLLAANSQLWQTSLGPSNRAARGRLGGRDYKELSVLGVVPGNRSKRADDLHLLRSAEVLKLDTMESMFSPVLTHRATAATVHLLLGGSTSGSLTGTYNTSQRRHAKFSLNKNRSNGRFVDKLSFVSPTSKPREGSFCFSPEEIPNYETASDDDTFPKDALRLEHRGEVKIVGWNKRILCSCQKCGILKGTLMLDDGDVDEDTIEGTLPLPVPPPVFAVAMPNFYKYAVETPVTGAIPVGTGGSPGISVPGVSGLVPDLEGAIPNIGSSIPDLNISIPSITDFVPTVDGIVPNLSDFVPDINDYIPDLNGIIPNVNDFIPDLNGVIPNVNDYIPDLNGAVPNINGIVPDLNGSIPNINASIPNVNDYIPDINGVVNGAIPNINTSIPNVNDYIPDINGVVNGAIPNINTSIPNVNDYIPDINGVVNGAIPNINASIPNVNDYIPDINGVVNGAIPNINASIPNVNDYIPDLNGAVPNINGIVPDLNGSIPNINASIPNVNDYIPDINGVVSEAIPDINVAIPNITDFVPTVGVVIPELNDFIPNVNDYIPDLNVAIPNVNVDIPGVNDYISDANEVIGDVNAEVNDRLSDVNELASEAEEAFGNILNDPINNSELCPFCE